MGEITPYIFIAVFGGAVFLDIFGHRRRGLYRKSADKAFLAALFVFLGISLLVAFTGRTRENDDTPGQYIAWQYLLENDPSSALAIVAGDGDMGEGTKQLITVMAEAADGDYASLYLDARAFLDERGHDAGQMHIVDTLCKSAEDALKGKKVSGSETAALLKSGYGLTGIEETEALKNLYDTDRSIRKDGADTVSDDDIRTLLAGFPGYDLVQKIAIRYYLTKNDFTSAESLSRGLIETRQTGANYVLYTDVLAQEAFSEETDDLAESTDREVEVLVQKAASHYETAMSANGNDVDRIEGSLEQAEEYYAQARGVFYQRLINFLVLKRNQGFDGDGVITLQKLKLEVLKGDYEAASADIETLLSSIEALDTASPIRENLLRVRDLQQKLREGDDAQRDDVFREMCAAVSDLLDGAGGMILTGSDDNINGRASEVISAMIRCSLPSLAITGTDTSRYPKTEVDFSLNLRKRNIIGGPGEYYADDFTYTDMGETVRDCKVTAYNGYADRAAALVLDLQNHELSENDLNDLKEALYTLVGDNRAAKRYALVNSTSYIQTELTEQDLEFRYSVRNINTQYAVSAYTCLNTAMDILDTAGREDDKTLIYITDGSTLSEEELFSAVHRASQSGIRVYAFSIGTVEDGYTDSLCRAAGGLSLHVPYYGQLCVFTGRLAEMMNYRYSAVFTAQTDVEERAEREFGIRLNGTDVYDTITYGGDGA